jgi:Xaa-Pro aminopeptidase
MNRLEGLAEWLPDGHCAALVTSGANVRYLCGFFGICGIMLVTREQSYLLCEAASFEQARRNVNCCRVMLTDNASGQLFDLLVKHNVKRIFVETDSMTVRELSYYKESLHYAEIDGSDELSEKLMSMRLVKSEDEIALIARAQRISEKAYERLLGTIRCGMSEKQIAAMMNYLLMDCGADGLSFLTKVASGENCSYPNALPTDRKLGKGELLTLEFGAVRGGYHSKTTRTIAAGSVGAKTEETYNAVRSACSDAIKVLRADVNGKVADSVARSTLNAWGELDRFFPTDLGHGLGLSVNEAPFLSRKGGCVLRAGMVVTVEPCVCIPGKLGIRMADIAVIDENGCMNLTNCTKNLIRI